VTTKEVTEMLSKIDLNSLSDEELRSIGDLLSTTGTKIKCILIRRKCLQIRHPSKADTKTN